MELSPSTPTAQVKGLWVYTIPPKLDAFSSCRAEASTRTRYSWVAKIAEEELEMVQAWLHATETY